MQQTVESWIALAHTGTIKLNSSCRGRGSSTGFQWPKRTGRSSPAPCHRQCKLDINRRLNLHWHLQSRWPIHIAVITCEGGNESKPALKLPRHPEWLLFLVDQQFFVWGLTEKKLNGPKKWSLKGKEEKNQIKNKRTLKYSKVRHV